MMATHGLIALLGEIALLLWGVHMVQSGVLRAFGAGLRRLLASALRRTGWSVLSGIAVTALLQSSTATAMMTGSLAASGMVDLTAALAVMLGANVGTTFIVQLMSFDITLVFPVLLFAGVMAFRHGARTRTRDLGRVALGLGLVLLALHLMVHEIAPAESWPPLHDALAAMTHEPLLNVAVAALLAWATHSSVAAMLFIMSLAGIGALTPAAALAMALGANLGGAVAPLIESDRSNPAALRLPLGNLAIRATGVLAALPFLGPIAAGLAWLDPNPARAVADFHLGFNLVLALVYLPLLPIVSQLLHRLLPDQTKPEHPGRPKHLDPHALATPVLALANAGMEVMRMVDVAEAMLERSQSLLHSDDRKLSAKIIRMDDTLDRLNAAVQRYLARIDPDALSPDEARRLDEVLAMSLNLEHLGDIMEHSLMKLSAKRIKHHLTFTPEEQSQLDAAHTRLLEHLQLALAIFMSQDTETARRLVAEKDAFRAWEREAGERHLQMLREGRADAPKVGAIFLDMMRDLKRIDAHLAQTTHPLLERAGGLNPTRLAS
jgi:phosphate:Na+ symporter